MRQVTRVIFLKALITGAILTATLLFAGTSSVRNELGISALAQANPKFLTYPFPSNPDMKVQQGWHYGIDYIRGTRDIKNTWTNFDVLAAADGDVCRSWYEGGQWNVGGWYVRIAHTEGGTHFTTEYNHLDSAESFIPLCNNTTHVARGQKIGVAGDRNLANCQPPCIHLHFELRVDSTIPNPNGTTVDPYDIWDSDAASYPDPNYGPSGLMGPNHYWTTDPPSYQYQNSCELCCAIGSSSTVKGSVLLNATNSVDKSFPPKMATTGNAHTLPAASRVPSLMQLVPTPLLTPTTVDKLNSVLLTAEPAVISLPASVSFVREQTIAQLDTSPPASVHYRLLQSVFGSGGGGKASAHYLMQGTTGQVTGVGWHESSHYVLRSGYWGDWTSGLYGVYLPLVLK